MAVLGLQAVQRVYERLRKPDERDLPYKSILRALSEKLQMYKLDLQFSAPSLQTVYSDWFTPGSQDVLLSDISEDFENFGFPVKVKMRETGATGEDAEDIPIVNYDFLSNSPGAVSFHGDPLRMIFSDELLPLAEVEFRVGYEADYLIAVDLDDELDLPSYFVPMLTLETAYELLEQVEDNTPEWRQFVAGVNPKWHAQLESWKEKWTKFVDAYGRSWKHKV